MQAAIPVPPPKLTPAYFHSQSFLTPPPKDTCELPPGLDQGETAHPGLGHLPLRALRGPIQDHCSKPMRMPNTEIRGARCKARLPCGIAERIAVHGCRCRAILAPALLPGGGFEVGGELFVGRR